MEAILEKLKHKPSITEFKPVEIILEGNTPTVAADAAAASDKAPLTTIVDRRADHVIDRADIMTKLQRSMHRKNIPTVFNKPVIDTLPAEKRGGPPPLPNPIAAAISEKPKKIKKTVRIKTDVDSDTDEDAPTIIPLEATTPTPTEKQRITKAPIKGYVDLGHEILVKIGDTAIADRLPKRKPQVNIRVDSYYMNNREKFVNFINSIFEPYREELEDKENITCDNLGAQSTGELLTHQKIVRDYMNLYTPYRGLLVQHGLGSGKTLTSIAIAEGMKSAKRVIILTPASLRTNYIEELKRFGDELYRKNQYWEWVSLDTPQVPRQELLNTLAKVLNLPIEYITRRKGAWLINVKKPPNFGELTAEQKKTVDEQLNEMIQAKYTFINYNGLRYSKLRELTEDFTKNIFDDSIVVIDEAHNLISRIVNKIKIDPAFAVHPNTAKKETRAHEPRYISTRMYADLMSASNARIVLLTGTPIINYPNEFAILFNILRGYIKTWRMQVTVKTTQKVTTAYIRDILQSEKTLDYVDYSPSSKTLTITRNPFGFRNVYRGKGAATAAPAAIDYKGVSKIPTADIETSPFVSDQQFEQNITRILAQNGIEVIPSTRHVTNYKALPDDFEGFTEKYVNPATKEIINADALKRRILGLTSYYQSAQMALLPRYNKQLGVDYHIIRIPMSDFQFGIYETARVGEREMDKNSRKPKKENNLEDLYEKNTSTYRIASRMYCNYVMNGRPTLPKEEREMRLAKKLKNAEKKGGDGDIAAQEDELELEEDDMAGGARRKVISLDDSEDDITETTKDDVTETDKDDITKTDKDDITETDKDDVTETDKDDVTETDKDDITETDKDDVAASGPLKRERRKKVSIIAPSVETLDAASLKILKDAETNEDLEINKEGEVEGDEVLDNLGGALYKEQIQHVLDLMDAEPAEYVSKRALETHSPKFLTMLENIQDPQYPGLHLVYSQFRTLEGIGIFSKVLDHNGFTRFRISKSESTGQWKINLDEIRERGYPTYALYTGKETAEEKEIIRNIYNGDWDFVPTNLVADLRTFGANNNMGEVIKVLMITSSGSEGINLRNTRYVHVMEPYWHPVRVEQVIGRARRICSHKGLPEELRTVEVFIYLMVFTAEQLKSDKSIELRLHDKGPLNPDAGPVTSDQYLFEVSEIKARVSRQLIEVTKESAFDCFIYNGKKCVNFANPGPNDFTFVPDYAKQENDTTAAANMKKVEWAAVPITIGDMEYAGKKVADGYEIYDLRSYQQGNPVQVGMLETKDGRMAFTTVVR